MCDVSMLFSAKNTSLTFVGQFHHRSLAVNFNLAYNPEISIIMLEMCMGPNGRFYRSYSDNSNLHTRTVIAISVCPINGGNPLSMAKILKR